MRDKISTIFGRAIFFLALISIFLPSYYIEIYGTIYILGNIAFFISGILYLTATNRNKKNIMEVGFGFGLFAWTELIITTVYGIIWSQNQIIEKSYSTSVFFYTISAPSDVKLCLYGSIIHLILAIVGSISGIIAIVRMRPDIIEIEGNLDIKHLFYPESIFRRTRLKNKCPNCEAIIREHANFCVRCGLELKICEICNHFIKNGEETIICSFCNITFHKSEYLEWKKIKGHCPYCKT